MGKFVQQTKIIKWMKICANINFKSTESKNPRMFYFRNEKKNYSSSYKLNHLNHYVQYTCMYRVLA